MMERLFCLLAFILKPFGIIYSDKDWDPKLNSFVNEDDLNTDIESSRMNGNNLNIVAIFIDGSRVNLSAKQIFDSDFVLII